MFVQQLVDFAAAALCAECLGGAMCEAPCKAVAGQSGFTPMELGQAQGQGHAAYTPLRDFAGCHGGRGGAGGIAGERTCHYCGQPGHLMLSCPKLKYDMVACEVGGGSIVDCR